MGALAIRAAVALLLLPVLHVESSNVGCDFFQGRWIYDDSGDYPLYDTPNCPFIEKEFDCLKNGRPDTDYLNYRWQPSHCDLPRFNGQDLLKKLKGKRIMFVGDSLSLNQWQSLTCMLHTSVPEANYTLVRIGGLSIFTLPSYKVQVMFSRNAFLVDIVRTSRGPILKLDSIEGGKLWKGTDVLVFNSWHWWLHTGRKQPWRFIEEGNEIYNDMDRLVGYEKGLNTWAKWIDTNLNHSRTKVFFQGVSPDHNKGYEWGQSSAKTCEGEAKPVEGSEYPGGPHPAELVLERVLRGMSKPVYLLNITNLSQLRKDGHPSVYGHGGHRDMDCSHWCLPGVPDTWNQLLYIAITTQLQPN